MKDLILISAFCNTKDKEEVLRGLVNDCQTVKDKFDIMLVSHTVIPDDIAEKTDYSLYDKKNELLYDWDMRSKPWFSPDNVREILSIFTGDFNTHLAVWRLVILGNSLAKNLGYEKVHHIEYDTRINNFSELRKNSQLLDGNDVVLYRFRRNSTVDPILFGSYQAYRTSSLRPLLYDLNEDEIKRMIKESPVKSPEVMLDKLLSQDRRVVNKSTDDLFIGNRFAYSHDLNTRTDAAWCLPYYDELTNRLCFIVWNMEHYEKHIDVTIVYNNERTYSYIVGPQHWYINDLDEYENAKELIVILNGKIRNHFKFDEYREKFKEVSFRRAKSNI
jgi:hypothetical protein